MFPAEQAFVGRDEKRAPLKTPAWEATAQWRFNCKNISDKKHIYVLFQATFHFKTFKADEDKTPIDCSKELGQPFELLIGKKFKLEVWEELIKTMREKEVARFTCNKLVRSY